MKTLTQIREAVGQGIYDAMELIAERELANHPEFWQRASAWHSVIYESILKQYRENYSPQTKPVNDGETRKEMDKTADTQRKERRYLQI